MSVEQRKAMEKASKCRLAYNEFRATSKWLEENGFNVSVSSLDDSVTISKTEVISL